MKRRTVAKGVYEDAYGYEVRWRDGRARSKRFPSDAPLADLKAYRTRMQRQAGDRRQAAGDGSFVPMSRASCARAKAGRASRVTARISAHGRHSFGASRGSVLGATRF